ncbi:MAG: hypothetical protein IJP03_02975 [Christensenellaceae bacterium]|nr:hypothetical protein [Christensenellaceae bacterium]
MKKSFKYMVMILVVALALVMLSACGGQRQLTGPAPDEGATVYEVSAVCNIEKADNVLRVTAEECTLMNGVVLEFSVNTYDGIKLASKQYVKASDNMYAEFVIDPAWSGKIYGSVVCQPDSVVSQEKEVDQAYGKKFQNIKGEQVLFDMNGNVFAAISEFIEL